MRCPTQGSTMLSLVLLWIFSHVKSARGALLTSQKCDEALTSPLAHTAFTSSSIFSNGYAPGYAKLNRRGGAGGWSPLDSDHYQWLQVDLGSRKQVSAIATQGRYSSSDWTTQYRLLYSDTGRNWKPYHKDGNIWAFSGNSNSESAVRHELQQGIVARFLRLVPLDWSEEGRIGLRIEVYGCSYWAGVINFDGQGVISYRFKVKKMKIIKDVIALRFKTSESEGVILHGEGQQGDYITLELWKAKLLLQINLGSNQYGSILGHTSVTTGSLLDDNHWHALVIERYRRNVNFTLDRHTQHFRTNGEFDHLDLDYELSFGGMPYSGKPVGGGRKNFKGCMESINYNGDNVTDLARRKKLDTSSFRNLSFSCAETHTFPVFFNATSFLQLPGRANHNTISVSFQFRTWNPDGLLLFSNLDDGMLEISLEDSKVVVHINVTMETSNNRVDLSSGHKCKLSSRLCNTPDGTPYTWWVGRGSEKHFYWGGSAPGIQKCACGIDRNCTDTKYDCNCDADQKQWREDSGLLVNKEHLPVSQVAVGDTNRPGSEATLTVGPLRCQGDDNYWNAASFTTPSSYLHFATFQGETRADISFYFKTSAPYGVFLENLGNTDFIRLELKSVKVVCFSFDVGNGPVELTVHSSSPLNDDQWHRVIAERNVKEAVLQLDQTYRTSRLAPAQGHTRLELFSQLYVGKPASLTCHDSAAGGQRGFLGCIRALRMNGITLDLEERAKVTPGVKPGCQGHCTSYGMYCRNGGKCVEKYNGYLCDCVSTAYDGPFCTRDVGGFFEVGTLVKYNLMPEAVAGASRDGDILHHQQLTPHGVNLTKEEVAFSFSTSNAPAILMYISSKMEDYMAVVLKQNGSLQVRYNLGGLRGPFSIDVDQRNLANGQPHSINMSRVDRSITIQLDHYPPVSYTLPDASDTQFNLVKTLFLGKVFETGHVDPFLIEYYNTPGFVGCLSRVQFNGIAPLKSALRAAAKAATATAAQPDRNAAAVSLVSYQGKLVESNCGASPLTIPPMSAATDPWHLDNTDAESPFNEERVIPDGVNRDSAIIGGIIAVVIFTILCTLVFLIRYMFRHKGTYHTNEAKGSGESAGESADTAIIGTDNPETIDESKKEWFI
ncbi:contactin-associated protein-like 2a [Brachionichthys hirsutus]|uniref:contactin-associated protein-like 2a n=1 Tax=Brachionichthys hirsutus TaxID=412623 RepID=UPI003604C317